MINIWDYVGANNILVTTNAGENFKGNVICVDDVDEMCDATEDEITIETQNGEAIEFKPSEIAKIERLNNA